MVSSLKEATRASGIAPPYALATADSLLGVDTRRDHALGAHVHSDIQALHKQMEAQTSSLKELQRQLDEGYKQKRRLQLAQRLMTGIMQMNKAERARCVLWGKLVSGGACRASKGPRGKIA